MSVIKEEDRTQWCIGTESYANCANCYRHKCEKRTAKASNSLPSATSLEHNNFNRGRHIMGGFGRP